MKKIDYLGSIIFRETGIRHEEKKKSCEDNVYTAFSKDTGVKVVTLSDGAGSYKNAAIGSEYASRIAADLIANKFNLLYELDCETTAQYILKEIRNHLGEEAKIRGDEIISYSATLLCAAMHPDGRYIVFHVGDGAVVGYNLKDGCRVVSIYEHEGPANQTEFVTEDSPNYNLFKGQGQYDSFVLMSDGPEDFLVNEVEINPRVKMMIQLSYFVSEGAMKEQLASLINLLKDNGMTDDASFAIIYDARKTSDVFASLSPEMRSMLFEVDKEIGSKKLKKIFEVINIITLYPKGASLQQISRQLHVHSPKIAKRKINFMIDMKLIECVNGKYIISK